MNRCLMTRQGIFCLLMLIALVTCRRKNEDVMPTGDALLLGVGIPGIFTENISINHTKKQITVTIPATATAVNYRAISFQTTPGSSVWRQNETNFSINLCKNQTPQVYVLSTTNTLNIYSFVIQPAGALQVDFIDNQPTAIIGQPISMQIENFLDGHGNGQVILTRTGTSEQDTLAAYCCLGSDSCTESQKKQFSIGIPQRVRPGEYTVEVYKPNGRRAVAAQKLTVKKGTPLLKPAWYGTLATVKSRNIVFAGENLFADDNPELIFRSMTGENFRVTPTAVSAYGWNMTVDLPATMPAGYYDVQLVLRGLSTDSHIRLPVLQQPDQPFVASINYGSGTLEPISTAPFLLQRENGYRVTIMPQVSGWGGVPVKLQIRLVRLSELTQSFLFTFTNSYYNSDYPPALVIPAVVTPGRYRFFVVATYPDGRVLESEPLERPVDIL